MPARYEPLLLAELVTRLAEVRGSLLEPARAGRPARIMVTMPAVAAGDPGLVTGLVDAGMDVARINSAHDDIETWTAIARRALGRHGRVLVRREAGQRVPRSAMLRWR